MRKRDLQGWFDSHPAISIRQFAIECGFSQQGSYFEKWLKTPPKIMGERVATKMYRQIKPVLLRYGWEQRDKDALSLAEAKDRIARREGYEDWIMEYIKNQDTAEGGEDFRIEGEGAIA